MRHARTEATATTEGGGVAGTLNLMRLFAALPLSPLVSERLLSLRLRLSSPGDGLRWSTPEQWHITLQFFGDTTPAIASCLETILSKLQSPAPEIVLSSLGTFSAKGILFAAVEPTPALLAFQAEVETLSRSCGFAPELRPFRPHITLARSKGKAGNATLWKLSSPTLPPFGPELRFTGAECLLLESTLQSQGARYSVHARLPLAPADDLAVQEP